MQKTKKTKIATIALVLILILTALIAWLPAVNAQAVEYDTYPFLSVTPTPIGAGQTATIVMWLSNLPQLDENEWAIRWEGFVITVTKPDGSEATLGPFTSDPVGLAYTQYTPDQTGTYTLQFSFPGQTVPEGYYMAAIAPAVFTPPVYFPEQYYKPSTTTEELIVQQDPIEAYPDWPLPEDYWERPIEAENREWWKISGNWLRVGDPVNLYSKAPKTAHIVWTKELAFGGVVGGEYGTIQYYEGLSYERKFAPIIMNGRLYYSLPLSNNPTGGGTVCVDLRTGEELWQQDITINLGQLYDYESPNQHGVIPYLWQTAGTYKAYDPFSGQLAYTLENALGGSIVFSPVGDMLVYILRDNWLAMWNSSSIPGLRLGETGTLAWQWRPVGLTLDWRDGIQWNVTVPAVPGQMIMNINSDIIIAFAAPSGRIGTVQEPVTWIAYDAKTGQRLWIKDEALPPGTTSYGYYGIMGDGVQTRYIKETRQAYGYDASTGDQLWISEPLDNAWDMYGLRQVIAYGKLFSATYGGRVYCHDVDSGQRLWTYYVGSSGFETVYGTWPLGSTPTVADGRVYIYSTEHSPSKPLWRSGGLWSIDAETGDLVWKILGWYESLAIADGYLVALNEADMRIYCFGKGKTATSVSVQNDIIAKGNSVLIKGTVTDQSPGAAGTPAIADEYMSEWMEYLYMQKPCPMDLNGVPVKLEAFGEDGSYIELGTVTSNAYGDFVYEWTPPDEKLYTIMATFQGSDSYWSSYDATYLLVGPAAAPSGPIEPEPSEAPLITTEVAIIVAVVIIAVVGIVAYWMLRKRK